MPSFIEKFKKLPKEIRVTIGSSLTKVRLAELEKIFYTEDLLIVIIRVLVGDLRDHDLDIALEERGVDEDKLELLKSELQTKFIKPYLKLLGGQQGLSMGSPESKVIISRFKSFLEQPEIGKIGSSIENLVYRDKNEDAKFSNTKYPILDTDFDAVKSKFYNAINEQDRLGFVSSLAQLASSGRIKELFKDDERYIKFWRNRVLKSEGLDGVRKFDENPVKPVIFTGFVKYLLESRFAVPLANAVLWGVFFSALAHRAGDKDYEKLAYGDLKEQKFRWNI